MALGMPMRKSCAPEPPSGRRAWDRRSGSGFSARQKVPSARCSPAHGPAAWAEPRPPRPGAARTRTGRCPAMLNTFMPALMSMEMRVLFWQRNSAAEALYTARERIGQRGDKPVQHGRVHHVVLNGAKARRRMGARRAHRQQRHCQRDQNGPAAPAAGRALGLVPAPRAQKLVVTTAPPVASACKQVEISRFSMSQRHAPKPPPRPPPETIMVSAMPTATTRICSITSGTSRLRSCALENSGLSVCKALVIGLSHSPDTVIPRSEPNEKKKDFSPARTGVY